jgi:hypothetical protein
VAQVVERLPSKCEALSSTSTTNPYPTPKKKKESPGTNGKLSHGLEKAV